MHYYYYYYYYYLWCSSSCGGSSNNSCTSSSTVTTDKAKGVRFPADTRCILFLSRNNPTSGGDRVSTWRFFSASIAFVRKRRRTESWYCSIIGKQCGGRPCKPLGLGRTSDTVWRLTDAYLLGIVAGKGNLARCSSGKWSPLLLLPSVYGHTRVWARARGERTAGSV
jgi:hypothetical protein